MLLTGVFTLNFPIILIAFAIGLPGLWWFLHHRREKNNAPMSRHWGIVSAVSAAALVVGGVLMPDTETVEDVATAADQTTDHVPTSTTSAAPTSTPSAPTSTTTERVTTAAVPAEPEPEPIILADAGSGSSSADADRDTARTPEPTPARAQAPNPAPAPAYTPPPAPAPAPVQPANPGAVTGRTVTPGAFCKDVETGMTGQTVTGLTVTCSKDPGGNRSRWRE